MKMTPLVLYLLRHAKSDHPIGVEDHERPLNAKGRQACRAIGAHLEKNHLKPSGILCSDAIRTKETLSRISPSSGFSCPVTYSKALYLATPGEMLKTIAKLSTPASPLLVVAHNPGIAQLATILCQGKGDSRALEEIRHKYPTAGFAVLHCFVNRWEELEPDSAELVTFISPAQFGH